MPVNYTAILACAIMAMVLSAVWYGPLFGKLWTDVVGATPADIEARKKMQQSAKPLYALQFLLVLFQAWVLAYYIQGWKDASGLVNSLWIWAAFVMPTAASSAMWNNDSGRIKWTRFLLQAGNQLVVFIMFGLILGYWK